MVNTLEVQHLLYELKDIGKSSIATYANAYQAGVKSAKPVQQILFNMIDFLGSSQVAFDYMVQQCLRMCIRHKEAIECVVDSDYEDALKEMNGSKKA